MSFEKILNNTAVLGILAVKIDDFEVPIDEITTIEIKQDLFNFGISGKILIKDSFDINNSGLLLFNAENKISISMTDIIKGKFYRTFRVTEVKSNPANERFKVVELSFVDEITYLLKNTYLSKSFNATPVKAFQECLTYIGIDTILKSNNMTYDIIDESEIEQFVVPQNANILDFFIWIFKQYNIRIWQDRYKLYIKSVIPSKIPIQQIDGTDITYSNHVLNNEYLFKIHDYEHTANKILKINTKKPITKTYRFSGNKEIISKTINLSDVETELKLSNSNISLLQHTNGEKYSDQSTYTTGNQSYDIFNNYMQMNQLEIVIPGALKYSNIVNVVNIKLKGNAIYAKSQMEGDILASGRYFVIGVSDRIIGDKIIQKLKLVRTDAQNPRGSS